ncbi:MAG: hypothetical protein QOF60_949 [Actinomycetota bacterium]|jgi:hypothetical protein|nr:hypothetical protein [Actinomycetota bacterium]
MTETGSRRRWRRNTLLVMVAVVGIGATAALGQVVRGPAGSSRPTVQLARPVGGGGESPTAASADGFTARQARVAGAGAAPGGAPAGQAVDNTLPAGLGAPKIVKTGSLSVEVKKGAFSSAFSQVATIAANNGGFVSSSSSSSSATGTVVLRIPADRFDDARRQLADLGKVTNEDLKGEDMGGTLADLHARLENLGTQEAAIRLIMGKAKTIGETIQVQDQLSQVREQIERLTSEQARLTDAVAFSTITVSVSEPGVAVVEAPKARSPLATSWGRALHGAEAIAAGLIVALGYLLPLAVVAGLGWLIARRARRSVNVQAGIPA